MLDVNVDTHIRLMGSSQGRRATVGIAVADDSRRNNFGEAAAIAGCSSR